MSDAAPVRVGLLATSPVYYQAPLYRLLAGEPRIDFTAIFISSEGATRPLQDGYGRPVEWGIDALGGYRSVFLRHADRTALGGGFFALRDLDVVPTLARGRFEVLVLHGYNSLTHVLAAMTQRMYRRAIIYREEQTLLSPRPLWKTALKAVGLRALFHNSYCLVIGTENARWFQRWGVPTTRLVHVPYAVDNEALTAAAAALSPERDRIRRELGVTSNSGPVILTVGRLVEKKRPIHLLKSFALARAVHPCTLLVVGSGPLESAFLQELRQLEIPDVSHVGFLDQTEIGRAYAAADILVLASGHDETWGIVVNEAMNFGLPIIATDQVGAAHDLIIDGVNGYVVDHESATELAEAIGRLVSDATLRTSFGAASRRMIERWNYQVASAGVLSAVERAVGANRWERAEGPRDKRRVEMQEIGPKASA